MLLAIVHHSPYFLRNITSTSNDHGDHGKIGGMISPFGFIQAELEARHPYKLQGQEVAAREVEVIG
jgi:hypothetical protein